LIQRAVKTEKISMQKNRNGKEIVFTKLIPELMMEGLATSCPILLISVRPPYRTGLDNRIPSVPGHP